eukprot:TRINITY_DN3584_c0_g1_i1.p1 TRINITY_DN3584_c0_g1~~TRINITY_DN3584_c0_g1_i1.p1  ORF type:complete len:117 (+),score=14.11 TRINITY_DN3584_c0_g1_i1:102-452(+)
MHDRGDYKSGWQLERECEGKQKSKHEGRSNGRTKRVVRARSRKQPIVNNRMSNYTDTSIESSSDSESSFVPYHGPPALYKEGVITPHVDNRAYIKQALKKRSKKDRRCERKNLSEE